MNLKQAKQFVSQFGFVLAKNQDGEYRLSPKLKMSDHDSRPVWIEKKNNKRLTKERAESIAAYFDDLNDVEQVKDMHNRMKHEFEYHAMEQASVEAASFEETAGIKEAVKKIAGFVTKIREGTVDLDSKGRYFEVTIKADVGQIDQFKATLLRGKNSITLQVRSFPENNVMTTYSITPGKNINKQVNEALGKFTNSVQKYYAKQAQARGKETATDFSTVDVENFTPSVSQAVAFINRWLKKHRVKWTAKNSKQKWAKEIIAKHGKKSLMHISNALRDETSPHTYVGASEETAAHDIFGAPIPLSAADIGIMAVMASAVIVSAIGSVITATNKIKRLYNNSTFAKYARIPVTAGVATPLEFKDKKTKKTSTVYMTFVGRKFSTIKFDLATAAEGGFRQRYIVKVGGFDGDNGEVDVGDLGRQVHASMKEFVAAATAHAKATGTKETAKTAVKKSTKKSPVSHHGAAVKSDNQKFASALTRKGFSKINITTPALKKTHLAYKREIDGVVVRVVWTKGGRTRNITLDMGDGVSNSLNFYSGKVQPAFVAVGRKMSDRLDEIEQKNPNKLDIKKLRKALSKVDSKFAGHDPDYVNPDHDPEKMSATGKRLLKTMTNLSDAALGGKTHDRATYNTAATLLFGKRDKKTREHIKDADGNIVHKGLVHTLSLKDLKTVLYHMDKEFFNKHGGKVWPHLKTRNDIGSAILKKVEGAAFNRSMGGTDHRYKTKEDMWNTPDRENYGEGRHDTPYRYQMTNKEKKTERRKEDERRKERNWRDDQVNKNKTGKLSKGDQIEDKGLFGRKKYRTVSKMLAAIETAKAAVKKPAKKAPAKKAPAKKSAPPKKPPVKKPAKKSPAKKAAPKKAPAKKAPAKKGAAGAGSGKADMKTPKAPAKKAAPKKSVMDNTDAFSAKRNSTTVPEGTKPMETPQPAAHTPPPQTVTPEATKAPSAKAEPRAKIADAKMKAFAEKFGVSVRVANRGFIGWMNEKAKTPVTINEALKGSPMAVFNYFARQYGQDKTAYMVDQFIAQMTAGGAKTKEKMADFVAIGSVLIANIETAHGGAHVTKRTGPEDAKSPHIPNHGIFHEKMSHRHPFMVGVMDTVAGNKESSYSKDSLERKVWSMGQAAAAKVMASGCEANSKQFTRALVPHAQKAMQTIKTYGNRKAK